MYLKKILYILILLFFLCTACKQAYVEQKLIDLEKGNEEIPQEPVPINKSWTHLIYMAADNSLDSQALNDINELEAAVPFSDKGMTVLVLVDRKQGNGDWSDTRLYEIRNSTGINSAEIVSDRLTSNELGISDQNISELNMSDPVTLERFIKFGIEKYTSDHYSLVLWGHGTGWRAIAIDETSNSIMPISSLAQAIKRALQAQTKISKFDVIGFDSCFGGLLEVCYPLRDTAIYCVASAGYTQDVGWNYTKLFNSFYNTTVSVNDFTNSIVDQFTEEYENVEGATISVINFEKMKSLQEHFNIWAKEVAIKIKFFANVEIKNAIRNSLLQEVDSFFYPGTKSDFYVDVVSMTKIFNEKFSLGEPTNVINAVNLAVSKTWSQKFLDSNKQIGVFVNTININRVFDTIHSLEYTVGSGLVTNPFILDTEGWSANITREANSILNALFY